MLIPDCYDPVTQAEAREAAWDRFVEDLPVCALCGHSVYPGDFFHEIRNAVVCSVCVDELSDNVRLVEGP